MTGNVYRPQRPSPVLDDEAVYINVNGALTCGEHAGSAARATGRDLYGVPLERVSAAVVARHPDLDWKCEQCDRRAGP